MTTGGINRVAFLGDNTTRRSPSPKIPAAGPRRARKSILSSTSSSKRRSKGRRPQRRLHVLHPSARAITRGPASARVRSTGTRALLLGLALALPGGTRQRGTPSHSNSTKVGTQHKNPRLAASLVGPWAESDGAAGRQLGAQARSLADTDNPMTAHAPPRTRNNNPDERTTATRASGNTRARSCPHRWTRRIS
ncbi:hypothetical protein OIU74_005796 [Salix koriyanagi]|uniref:Uncharacterized protein n=1 Tax=Salix koriyanagi TaxID=2511006 RepID=A0A9Q0NUC0_9ROSI|nr:hypothetical protein OIU74_005796 [Salix koriyanagi]